MGCKRLGFGLFQDDGDFWNDGSLRFDFGFGIDDEARGLGGSDWFGFGGRGGFRLGNGLWGERFGLIHDWGRGGFRFGDGFGGGWGTAEEVEAAEAAAGGG